MAVQPGDRSWQTSRYIRVNPDINREPPDLDAKDKISELQKSVAHILGAHRSKLKLEEIVFRLIASTFYFEKGHVTKNRMEGTATINGGHTYSSNHTVISNAISRDASMSV